MEKTATAAQVKEQFIVKDRAEALRGIKEALDKRWDKERSVELAAKIITELKEQIAKEGYKGKLAPIDNLGWVAREAYIFGFLQATDIMQDTNEMGYNALFGENA